MECRESTPERARLCTGTPITGSVVSEATIPGRCAAPPAPATITRNPSCLAWRAKSTISSGVRWAESTRTSTLTPSSSRAETAGFRVGKSESLPMITATRGVATIVGSDGLDTASLQRDCHRPALASKDHSPCAGSHTSVCPTAPPRTGTLSSGGFRSISKTALLIWG